VTVTVSRGESDTRRPAAEIAWLPAGRTGIVRWTPPGITGTEVAVVLREQRRSAAE
jgi:hypothetical protein